MQVGQVVSGYEVLGRLGSGGMGDVYKARHILSDRTEAMKVLRPEWGDGDMPERFLREIRVLASLSHPNIAGLRTAFLHEGRTVMVMEFVEGETLHSLLRLGGINLADGLRYLTEILSALQYAHERGVVHRDIKPANIMVAREGKTKLLDFGLAFTRSDATITRSGHILGSLQYMSPEQIRGEAIDARCDLYAVAVTLYEVLTGRLPIQGTNDVSTLLAHLEQQPVSPIEINPQIPKSLSEIAMRGLAKRPENRFASAGEFLSALQAAISYSAPTLVDMHTTVLRTARPASAGSSNNPISPTPTPGRTTGAGSAAAAASFEASTLESVSRNLATFIGPVAKIVVKRAASQCTTVEQLYAAVAAEIESEKDRARFLALRRVR